MQLVVYFDIINCVSSLNFTTFDTPSIYMWFVRLLWPISRGVEGLTEEQSMLVCLDIPRSGEWKE